jgi:hypothetical protein
MIFCRRPTTRETAEIAIMRFRVKELNFAQMYCILTDKTIDPYDETFERRKTSCCEII